MKMNLKFQLLFILFFICSQETNATQTSPPKQTLRVLTINVWSGLDYKGSLKMGEYESKKVRKKRYKALVAQINALAPDIIGLQEANKLPDYAERLAREMAYDAFYHLGIGGIRLGPVGLPWNLREGDVILAKKTLTPLSAGRKQLSGGYVGSWATFHFSDATQIVAVKVRVMNRPFFVFVTHWHASVLGTKEILEKANQSYQSGRSDEKEYQQALEKINEGVKWRLQESKKTLAFIQETAQNHPFILMGDFNAESGSEEIKNLLQAEMVDLFGVAHPHSPGFTWNPQTNLNIKTHYLNNQNHGENKGLFEELAKLHEATPKRIDYIFLGPATLVHSSKLKIKSSRIVMKELINDVHASDHYGVFAEIEFHE